MNTHRISGTILTSTRSQVYVGTAKVNNTARIPTLQKEENCVPYLRISWAYLVIGPDSLQWNPTVAQDNSFKHLQKNTARSRSRTPDSRFRNKCLPFFEESMFGRCCLWDCTIPLQLFGPLLYRLRDLLISKMGHTFLLPERGRFSQVIFVV